jgi:hypothetical protein
MNMQMYMRHFVISTLHRLLLRLTQEERDKSDIYGDSGQRFRLQIQRFRVLFPALPAFLISSGSGTGSTQPREYN